MPATAGSSRPALATELGAAVTEIDAEDYWEWVVGDVAGITVNWNG
jgi:hypothetical protein